MPAPDPRRAIEKYRHRARWYDAVVARSSRGLRRRAVELLELREGQIVLDVACGTGLSFGAIEHRIGPEGRLIGIDLSPDMLAKARERADRQGWRNVTLVEAPVEKAEIPVQADAALSVLTHDVMRSPRALENVLAHVRPGGGVVMAGAKWAGPWWAAPVNLVVWLAARPYVTTFEGFERPWDHLDRLVPDLSVQSVGFGGAYVASGTVPAGASGAREEG